MFTPTKHQGSCTVSAPAKACACGNPYNRIQHPKYPFTYPHCDCDETPAWYSITKSVDGHKYEFFYDSKGRKIRSLDDCYRVSCEITDDVQSGTFNKAKYKKRIGTPSVSDTIEQFVRDYLFPNRRELRLSLDDKIWMEDWLVPFIADVGVFTVSEIHLNDFIRTFYLKGDEKERAIRLFNLLKSQIHY